MVDAYLFELDDKRERIRREWNDVQKQRADHLGIDCLDDGQVLTFLAYGGSQVKVSAYGPDYVQVSGRIFDTMAEAVEFAMSECV